jgi:YVTN family beta-propeller protein
VGITRTFSAAESSRKILLDPVSGAARLEILLLGPVEVRVDGRALPLGRLKLRALLALLALNANRVVSTDRAIDALWGERPPATAPVALYGLVSQLRKLLDANSAVLVTKPPGYVLEVSSDHTDLGRFEELAAEGRAALDAGDAETASARLTEALGLWRGPPLQDLAFLSFAELEIGRIGELRLAAIEDRIEADLVRGLNGDLVRELEPLVAEYQLRERLRGQLMRALYGAGRQADALAAYRDARQTLHDELGLDPSDELQALERAILQHDSALAAKKNEASPATERARTRYRYRWIAVGGAAAAAAVVAVAVLALRDSGRGSVAVVPNGVGVLEDGRIVAAAPLGASPSDVATTSDSAWVTSTDAQTIARIDAGTGEVRQTIRVGSGASGVAADEHGVWVANSLDGTVTRIDPRANAAVDEIKVGTTPVALALRGDEVWVVNRDDQTLTRLDARTGRRTARIPVGTAPRAIAIGVQAVWVADEVRGTVFRISTARRRIVDQVNVGNGPLALAVGHGSVWVANSLDGTVSRIDPSRDAVTNTIWVGDGPRALAVTQKGVWVSNEFDGTLRLIDVNANRVVRTVRIGERPEGLAATATNLFVAVRPANTLHRGGTLRIAVPELEPSLDPLHWVSPATTLYDGLLGVRRVGGADGGQLVPDLAVSIPAPTDSGRAYTFRLRPGIRYSNGRLVQPADFRRALERGFRVEGGVSYYGAIIGAEQCAATPERCDLSRGIVTDARARTVTFHLGRPDPNFLFALAVPLAFAVPADTPVREIGSRPLPATGPYMVQSFDPRRQLTLVRNPFFREWSKAAQPDGYADKIVVTPVPSKLEQVRMAERGKIDFVFDIPRELQHEVFTQYASQVHVNPVRAVTYLFLNTRVPPFSDVRVRRALNYAADRAAGARSSTRGVGGYPTCQVLPPDFPGYEPYCPYTALGGRRGKWTAPDLKRARQLVAASGTRGATISVWVPANHRGEEAFVTKLLHSVGYRVRLRKVSTDAFTNVVFGNPHQTRVQAGPVSWFADIPAASNYLELFYACNGLGNGSGFCDRRIDRLIRRAGALGTTDLYRANRLWARIDRAVVDKAATVPLFTLKEVDIVSRRVGNYQYNPQWGVLSDQLWVR